MLAIPSVPFTDPLCLALPTSCLQMYRWHTKGALEFILKPEIRVWCAMNLPMMDGYAFFKYDALESAKNHAYDFNFRYDSYYTDVVYFMKFDTEDNLILFRLKWL